MNFKRKIALIMVVLLISVMVLNGCGGSSGGGTTSEGEKKKDPVSISLWSGYPEYDEWLAKMKEGYIAENPHVSIEITSFPLRDYETKIAAAIPARNCSDIITIAASYAIRYIEGGMILKAPQDMVSLVLSDAYPKEIAALAMYNGDVYGVPHKLTNAALFYNTEMFKEAGLTEPPKSLDDFVEYAKKLAKFDENGNLIRSGLSLRLTGGGSGLAEKFWYFTMQEGSGIVKEVSPGKYIADYNNEGGLNALRLYMNILYRDKTCNAEIKSDAAGFEAEATAMLIRESWVIGDIAEKAPDLPYDTAPLPYATIGVANNFYVTNSAKGDEIDTSWDFVRFIMRPENHKQQVVMSGWHPCRLDLDLEDYFEEVPQYRNFFMDYEEVHVYPVIAEFDEILTKFANHLCNEAYVSPDFLGNDTKMMEFLNRCAAETNEILKANGHLAE